MPFPFETARNLLLAEVGKSRKKLIDELESGQRDWKSS